MIWVVSIFGAMAFGLWQQEANGMQFSDAVAELRSNNSQPGHEPDFGTPLFPMDFDFEDQSRVVKAIETIERSLDEEGWQSLLKISDDGEYCVTLVADHDVAYSMSTTEVAYLIVVKTLVYPYSEDLAEVRTLLPGIETSWAASDLGKLEQIRNWAIASSPSASLVELQRLAGGKLETAIIASKLSDATKDTAIGKIRKRSQALEFARIPKNIVIGPTSGLQLVDASKANELRRSYAKRVLDKSLKPN